MKKFLLILMAGILASCSSVPTSKIEIPTPPKKAESVRPYLEKTSQGVNDSITENAILQEKVKDQKQAIFEQKLSIAEALDQAEKIKNKAAAQVAISEIEATNLIAKLKDVEARNLFVEKENEGYDARLLKQQELLYIARSNAYASAETAAAMEKENSELRNQNAYLSKALEVKNKEVQDMTGQKIKDAKKIGSASVYKHWIIGGVVIALLGAIVTWAIKAGWFVAKKQIPL